MAGSPKKRARKKARELAEQAAAGALPRTDASQPACRQGDDGAERLIPAGEIPPSEPEGTPKPGEPTAADRDLRDASSDAALPAALTGEVLAPPKAADDPTRTALKRAMRRKAEELAEEAMDRLATGMRNPDDRIGVPAAREVLDRAIGKPGAELDLGDKAGGMTVVILKFGDSLNDG